MSALETINLSHLPASLPIHVALYRDVQNAPFLRQQLISGNSDFEYALIDASMVGCEAPSNHLKASLILGYRSCQGPMLSQQSSGLLMTL